MRRVVHRITSFTEGETLDRNTLAALRRGWGNTAWSATLEYLEEMAHMAVNTEGPILECGSGLTTLLLGLLAGKRGVGVWSLEHLPEWYDRVGRTLNKYQIENVELCLAPLRDYGGYMWYDLPVERMPDDFRLVVCDGPPKETPGGRYGLYPVMGEHLAPNCVVLLDDAEREGEKRMLVRWAEETSVRVTLLGTERTFAVVAFS